MSDKRDIDTIDVSLQTLISDGIIIQQKLDRFNVYLAQSNEINRGLIDTITNHLAVIKAIGDGTKLIGDACSKIADQNKEVMKLLEEVRKELKKR